MGATNPLTCLVPDLSTTHPEDAFSLVPYEKGFAFLYHLESLLGGAEVFEAYLLNYVNHFKYKSLSTGEWKEHLYQYFSDKVRCFTSKQNITK